MIISNLRKQEHEGRWRVTAHVAWEEYDAAGREVYLETTEPFGAWLEPNPEVFLLGCLHPAIEKGERRIRVEGEVCPQLLETLESAMALLHAWFGDSYQPINIEVEGLRLPQGPEGRDRTAVFLSGGVDSLTALRKNHLLYPKDHPNRIRDGFLIHGFDIGGVVEKGLKYPVFDRAVKAMASIAEASDLKLIPVYTNLRHLCDERAFWVDKFFGAILAAVAHGFRSRINRVEIASSYDIRHLIPSASHPMLDQWYSSSDLRMHHRDVELSRVEKIAVISEWDVAMDNLRVCLQNVPDRLNCGWCEKCVRTMTGFVAAGALHKCGAFAENDVSPELLATSKAKIIHQDSFYQELYEPLRQRGRDDLARIIEQMQHDSGSN